MLLFLFLSTAEVSSDDNAPDAKHLSLIRSGFVYLAVPDDTVTVQKSIC